MPIFVFTIYLYFCKVKEKKMVVKISDVRLREAAAQGMDAFLEVIVSAIRAAMGGELTAETMGRLNSDQTTLIAWDILREEVMDGGFVQLIYNGFGGFFFRNPFAKVMKMWGLRELGKLMYGVGKLYFQYGEEIEKDCSDEEFMALFERFPQFDEYDDEFVENEEDWTERISIYVDEHLEQFVVVG